MHGYVQNVIWGGDEEVITQREATISKLKGALERVKQGEVAAAEAREEEEEDTVVDSEE